MRVNPRPVARQRTRATDLKKAIALLFNPPSSVPETALLFFAGHGLLQEEGEIREGFLAATDTNPKRNNWGFSLNWLRQVLEKSPVRQQIVWLDCCHSGALLNFDEADPGAKAAKSDRSFIAASRDFESAYESVAGEHGILTSALLQGLDPSQQEANWTTNYSLVDFIKKQLAKERQRPVFHNSGGEIVLTGKKETIDKAILMSEVCPYKGLESFGFNEEDPKYFYGRRALTDELLDKIRSSNFLAVVGASGSGKSSVVKAGLLHQLKLGQRLSGSESWPIRIFRPYSEARGLDPTGEILARQDLARDWNSLCRYGSLRGQAAKVMDACETAVAIEPENGDILDSRGLARALTGDTAGAIEDFEAAIELSYNEEYKSQLQGYIDALRKGENPFTTEEIDKSLKEEEEFLNLVFLGKAEKPGFLYNTWFLAPVFLAKLRNPVFFTIPGFWLPVVSYPIYLGAL